MKKLFFIFKLSLTVLSLAVLLVFSAVAADFEELSSYFLSAGISANNIGDENDYVSADQGKAFFFQFADLAVGEALEANVFGDNITKAEFITELLGVLGYSAEKGDFLSEFPYDKAASVGLIYALDPASDYLTNAEMLEFAYYALSARTADGDTLSVSTYAEFPEISEGALVGLTNYYDPNRSSDIVEIFDSGFGDFSVENSKKFEVCVTQVNGKYHADAKISVLPTMTCAESLYLGEYFVGLAYSGADITVTIKMNSDIESGYSINSDKEAFTDVFKDGVLKITVTEPQILRICYDGAAGKTLTVYVGEKDVASAKSIGDFMNSEDALASLIYSSEADVKYICPGKVILASTVAYYPAYVKGSKAYLNSSLYDGSYDGKNKIKINGEYYILSDEFSGNGSFGECSYDASAGILRIAAEAKSGAVDVEGYVRCNDSAKAEVTTSSVSFESVSDGFTGVIAEIAEAGLFTEDCLRFEADMVMTGSDIGVPLTLSIIGYNSRGETDVITTVDTRCYKNVKNNVQYLDLSLNDDVYERYYLVISSDTESGVSITVSGASLQAYKSPEFGDNEFNPFAL